MDTPVTLDALMKEMKALRKEVRKIRTHYLKDPNAPEKKPRAKKTETSPEGEAAPVEAPKEKKLRPKVAKPTAA